MREHGRIKNDTCIWCIIVFKNAKRTMDSSWVIQLAEWVWESNVKVLIIGMMKSSHVLTCFARLWWPPFSRQNRHFLFISPAVHAKPPLRPCPHGIRATSDSSRRQETTLRTVASVHNYSGSHWLPLLVALSMVKRANYARRIYESPTLHHAHPRLT